MGSNYAFDDDRSVISGEEESRMGAEVRGGPVHEFCGYQDQTGEGKLRDLGEEADFEEDGGSEEAENFESDTESKGDEDEENWEDEDDGSDESNAEDLLDWAESLFDTAGQDRVTAAEAFDHQDYCFSFAPPSALPNTTTAPPPVYQNPDEQQETPKRGEVRDEGTQTHELDSAGLPISPIDVVENARKEINELRDARASIVPQRKEFYDRIKKGSNPDLTDYTSFYEYDEALDAIDTAIDYKNELICGHEFVLTNDGSTSKGANLVTRLTNLSILDLQRLVCKLFSKIVDLRCSLDTSDQLVNDLETKQDQTSQQLAEMKDHMKEREQENEARIKMILKQSKDPFAASQYEHYRKSIDAAKRKQEDLKMSLTALMSNHGYFDNRNIADCDVNQILKMLGIDPLSLRLCQMEDEDVPRKPNSEIPLKLHSALVSCAGAPGISSRVRERSGGAPKVRETNGGPDKFRERSGGNGLRERSRERDRLRHRDRDNSSHHNKPHPALNMPQAVVPAHLSQHQAHRQSSRHGLSQHQPSSSSSRRHHLSTSTNGHHTNKYYYQDRDRERQNGHDRHHQTTSNHHHRDRGGEGRVEQSQHYLEVKRDAKKLTIQFPQNHH